MPLVKRWPYPQPKTYYDVKRSQKPITVNQGGSRSGKTYSTIQALCEFCQAHKDQNLTISIVRKTLPSLKATAYRDFMEILLKEGWYDEKYHNKSNMEYHLFGNLVEFFAIDQPQKVRGRKRHICFINEANELTYEEYFQLNVRTTFKMICDFNPSDEYHWLYELEEKSPGKVDFFVSNYTHNPHLDEGLVAKIEELEKADPDYWRVFGMGLRGASRELIFTHWQQCPKLPGLGTVVYGQDFGFNNASALVRVEIFDGAVYAEELLYKPKLITTDIANHYPLFGMEYNDYLYCDAAAADSIEELQRFGWNAIKAKKDVLEGINKLKSMPLFVTAGSANLIKELRNYKWKKDPNTEVISDEPVKYNDHAIDALRYAVYSHEAKPKRQRSYSY